MTEAALPCSGKEGCKFKVDRIRVIKQQSAIRRGVHERLKLQGGGRRQVGGPGRESCVAAGIERSAGPSAIQLPQPNLAIRLDAQAAVEVLLDAKSNR